jgi:hypothetical protein
MAQCGPLIPAMHEGFDTENMSNQDHPVINGIGFKLAKRFLTFRVLYGVIGGRILVAPGVEDQLHLRQIWFANIMTVGFHRLPKHGIAQHLNI